MARAVQWSLARVHNLLGQWSGPEVQITTRLAIPNKIVPSCFQITQKYVEPEGLPLFDITSDMERVKANPSNHFEFAAEEYLLSM